MINDDEKFEEIKRFWAQAGHKERDAQGLRPTARDPYLQTVVEDSVLKYLPRGSDILDVGCGDGTSTERFSSVANKITGVDYSESLLERAIGSAQREGIANVKYCLADVTALDIADLGEPGLFDAGISIRCLINLPSFELQSRAFSNISARLKSGAVFILSEGWQEGWEGLNLERQRCGLPPITIAEYNKLISRTDLESMFRSDFDLITYHSLGLYIFISRVVQPFLVAPNQPRHDHELNRVASELQLNSCLSGKLEHLDYAGLYVLRKK